MVAARHCERMARNLRQHVFEISAHRLQRTLRAECIRKSGGHDDPRPHVDVWAALSVGLVHAYDPTLIPIGGGAMEAADEILPHIESHALASILFT